MGRLAKKLINICFFRLEWDITLPYTMHIGWKEAGFMNLSFSRRFDAFLSDFQDDSEFDSWASGTEVSCLLYFYTAITGVY